jgi:hypothetical protein
MKFLTSHTIMLCFIASFTLMTTVLLADVIFDEDVLHTVSGLSGINGLHRLRYACLINENIVPNAGSAVIRHDTGSTLNWALEIHNN